MIDATLLEPWITSVEYLMRIIQILVGGLFGLYVVEFIYRIFTFRKLRKQMNNLLAEIQEVKERLDKIDRKKH